MIIARSVLERWLAPMIFLSVFSLFLNFQSVQAAELTVTNAAPSQGETVELTATAGDSEPPPSSVAFNNHTYKLFPKSGSGDGKQFVALIGIPADLKPGKYAAFVGDNKIDLSVKAGKFPIQYLTLPKSKDNFLTSPGEEEGIAAAKSTISEKRMWTGIFTVPSKYPMSSKFGQKRVVNGKLLDDYYHSGLDFRAPAGSPIVSCAPGKVVMVGLKWRLHGNCVAVDHGQGVVSIYIHMTSVGVKVGQEVEAGQKLGTVGATGRASGPHLHWSLYVNNVATNPQPWIAVPNSKVWLVAKAQ
ncbi:MAG: M23 family metallopeptidase [Candidatus Melainabacteria bacterium]|nr:MAG: M23 family metallopeptidase [Candidatus Melainabacteria bacterium]